LGSSSLITDLDGNVAQHIEYVPFGEFFIEERNSTWNTPYKFNAKELDEETGLYYYGARYYDPRISIWYGADPLQEKYPGISTYCYTRNNPVNLIDPTGRDTVWVHSDGKPIASIKSENEVMVVNDPLPEVEITPSSSSATSTTNSEATAVVVATPAVGELIGSTALRIGGGLLSLLFLTGDTDSHQRANVQQSQQATTVAASPNPNDFKKKKSNISGKEGAKDVPDWVKGEKPYRGENGKDFAKRVMDNKYGRGQWGDARSNPEFSKIQKWADRAFE
jgi:RHS repeat-associated protein